MTALERYVAAGREAGCSRDQMDNFVRAGVVLQPRPSPPGKLFCR
jgi:hypothetical protein